MAIKLVPPMTDSHWSRCLLKLVSGASLAALMTACTTQSVWLETGTLVTYLADESRLGRESVVSGQLPGYPSRNATTSQGTISSRRPEPYQIGPGDELLVMVWGRPDLGSQIPVAGDTRHSVAVVQSDGRLLLPFLGHIEVAGLTQEQARSLIEKRYESMLTNPQVDIQIQVYHSKPVYIFGTEEKSGILFLSQDLRTVGEAISAAGGVLKTHDRSSGILTRDSVSYPLDYHHAKTGESKTMDVMLEPNDSIYFSPLDERSLYVFGEVGRQGVYGIPQNGETLLGVIAKAQGLDKLTADKKSIYLLRFRQEDGAAAIYRFALLDLLASPDIQMQDGDRVFIPPTDLGVFYRTWTQLVPFFRSVTDVFRSNDLLFD